MAEASSQIHINPPGPMAVRENHMCETKSPQLHFIPASPLEKIFPDTPFPADKAYPAATALQGERFSFQAVYCLEGDVIFKGHIRAEGSLAAEAGIYETGLVPSQLPNYPDGDAFVLRTTPGLYPDPLFPLDENTTLTLIPGQWRSLWITVPSDKAQAAGSYDLTLTLTAKNSRKEEEKISGSCRFTLRRLGASLPPQTLMHTEWFHTDCIADFYRVPAFSEDHWGLIEQYIQTAVTYGCNMLLTPLFTPPLDTAPGGERTTVQLVDVFRHDGQYSFSFERLERWVAVCNRQGIKYLELSHLFTQWGAAHAPKIMAYPCAPEEAVRPAPIKIFGWETDADSPAYEEFLNAFLPRLVAFIQKNGLEKRVFFHISDEPSKEHLPAYLHARELLRRHIGDFPIMDALSDYEYYEQGIVRIPICSSNTIEPFLEHKVSGLWTYYCCSQYKEVANRFFCMPSLRNRILGIQLYYFNIKGFLQWGFNFWNAAFSTHPIHPFSVTDAELTYPSGDPFLVYPGEKGPIASLRAEVLMEGLQDMRALQLLESLTDRATVLAMIEHGLEKPFTFKDYPHEDVWLLELREKCNKEIERLS